MVGRRADLGNGREPGDGGSGGLLSGHGSGDPRRPSDRVAAVRRKRSQPRTGPHRARLARPSAGDAAAPDDAVLLARRQRRAPARSGCRGDGRQRGRRGRSPRGPARRRAGAAARRPRRRNRRFRPRHGDGGAGTPAVPAGSGRRRRGAGHPDRAGGQPARRRPRAKTPDPGCDQRDRPRCPRLPARGDAGAPPRARQPAARRRHRHPRNGCDGRCSRRRPGTAVGCRAPRRYPAGSHGWEPHVPAMHASSSPPVRESRGARACPATRERPRLSAHRRPAGADAAGRPRRPPRCRGGTAGPRSGGAGRPAGAPAAPDARRPARCPAHAI